MTSRTRQRVLAALTTVAVLGVLGIVGAAAFVWSGVYNVGATAQHWPLTYSVLEFAMKQSVRLRSSGIVVPALDDEQRVLRGALCFHVNCVQCHGAPGVAPAPIGRSMQPLPGPLHVAADRWSSAELYWITRNGIKMSGMPAWAFRMEDPDLWAVVAFLNRLPNLRPLQYRALIMPMAGLECSRGES